MLYSLNSCMRPVAVRYRFFSMNLVSSQGKSHPRHAAIRFGFPASKSRRYVFHV